MPATKPNPPESQKEMENQWKNIYLLGAVTTVIGLAGILLDTVVGSATGGNLSALPQTAVDRFAQLQANPLLGLYNLDLLNVINQVILIPTYFALYAAHRSGKSAYALLALVIFLVGSAVFISTNTALPMLDLSRKYMITASDTHRTLLAAAGEAMLARGAHGGLGVFIGFLLPSLASITMGCGMLAGKVFTKTTAILGIGGGTLISLYIILVTFAPGIGNYATAVSMPGGLMLMAWMVLFTIRLFKLGK